MKKLRLFFLLVLTTPVYSQVPVNSNNFNGATIPQKPEFESLSDSVFEKKLLQEVIITSKKSVSFETEVENYKNIRAKQKENSKSRSASPALQSQMNQQAEQLMQIDPSHVEAKVLFYDAGNYDAARSFALKEALNQNPRHQEALYLSAANAFVVGDTAGFAKEFQTLSAMEYFPSDVLCYSEDVVASVPQGYSLITHGRLDTYGFLWQQIKGARGDLFNVSLELLQSPQYREQMVKKNLRLPTTNSIDVDYLRNFIRLNPDRKFAFSMTLPKPYIVDFQKELLPNGLVFLYQPDASLEESYATNLHLNSSLKFLECGQKKDENYRFLLNNYLPMLMFIEAASEHEKTIDQTIKSDIEQKKQKIKKGN